LPYPPSPIRFRTFPDPSLPTGSHFRFVVSSCLKPNFPYAPFRNGRIKGFDLLADYLFTQPTVVDTPGAATFVDASDNTQESPIPLQDDDPIKSDSAVGSVTPAILGAEGVVPTEFMLFLVRNIFLIHHNNTLTRYRVTLYMQMSQSTMAILHMPIVVSIGATTTARASAKSTNDFVRS
jgi:hypothetical protein